MAPLASAGRRIVAAVASVWLVAALVLGARHEARVAHVHDRATGQLEHADRLIGKHTGSTSDFHGVSPSGYDHDECGVCAALHQAALPVAPHVDTLLATPSASAATRVAGHDVVSSIRAYRLAPKTSPPHVA